jgi:hypothetical protein
VRVTDSVAKLFRANTCIEIRSPPSPPDLSPADIGSCNGKPKQALILNENVLEQAGVLSAQGGVSRDRLEIAVGAVSGKYFHLPLALGMVQR